MASPRLAGRSWAIAANVYISEGRDAALLEEMRKAAGPPCVHVFADPAYHRTGFTLASRRHDDLHGAMLRLASLALERIDLRSHEASHPRLGIVDHVSVHPLLPNASSSADREAAQDAASALALRIGGSLGKRLPVYFYGAAAASAVPLDELRRSLGYFRGPTSPGAAPAPDLGPCAPDPRAGVVLVGSRAWVVNYNLALDWPDRNGPPHDAIGSTDSTSRAADVLLVRARRVAAQISQRRGGPAGCQSLALRHEGTVEIACNLLTPSAPSISVVHDLVEVAARAEGLRVVRQYCTGLSPEEILCMIP
jgi:glutamate formiminotransferase